jgi:DNA invertase Pin-like site-specific DNA recombinase
MTDAGLSGFTGANVRRGALGAFLKAIDDGEIETPCWLLVENLDRVTRRNPWDSFPIFQQIIKAGVTVATLFDGRVYDAASLRANPMAILESLFVLIRANQESETKSRRLKAVWLAKRARAAGDGQPMTEIGPYWLELVGDQWTVREDRAGVVRGIYQRAAAGAGHEKIAVELNRAGIKPFGNSEHWHRSSVTRILENPGAIGTLQPFTLEHDAKGKERRVAQEPVEGFYPAVVGRDLWDAVVALRVGSRATLRGRQSVLRNILSGVGRCPLCQSAMIRVSKGNRVKAGRPYIVCSKAKAGAGCKYHAVRLEDVERALRDNAGWLTSAPEATGGDDALKGSLRGLQDAIGAAEDEARNLAVAIARSPSPILSARLAETERALEAMRQEALDLQNRIDVASGPTVARRMGELREALEAETLDVERVNLALRRVAASVAVDWRAGRLGFEWVHGGTASVVFGWSPTD